MTGIELILLSFVVGVSAGVLIGMLGIGGGIVFVPFYYFVLPSFHVSPQFVPYFAIGTSLMAGAIASTNSAIAHSLQKNIILKKGLILSSGSVIASLVTPFFVVRTNAIVLHIIFSALFTIVAFRMLFGNGKMEDKKNSIKLPEIYLFGFGLVIGVVSAFSGIGGGLLYFPTLVYLFDTEIKPAVGTSSFATASTMIFSALSFSQQPIKSVVEGSIGYILIIPGLILGISAAIGSFLGVRIAIKSKDVYIKKIFAVILIIAVLKIILDI